MEEGQVGPTACSLFQDFSTVHAKSDGLTLNNDYNALYAEYLFRAKDNGVDEMLRRRFPKVPIVQGADAVQATLSVFTRFPSCEKGMGLNDHCDRSSGNLKPAQGEWAVRRDSWPATWLDFVKKHFGMK